MDKTNTIDGYYTHQLVRMLTQRKQKNPTEIHLIKHSLDIAWNRGRLMRFFFSCADDMCNINIAKRHRFGNVRCYLCNAFFNFFTIGNLKKK